MGQVCRVYFKWVKLLQVLYKPESTSPKSPSKYIKFEGDFAASQTILSEVGHPGQADRQQTGG